MLKVQRIAFLRMESLEGLGFRSRRALAVGVEECFI